MASNFQYTVTLNQAHTGQGSQHMPGFLKLLLSVKLVCVHLCVHPQAIKKFLMEVNHSLHKTTVFLCNINWICGLNKASILNGF